MKIWFDLSNSPHINFFASMIRELQESHEVIITCRPLANTIDLLKLHDFSFHIVGKYYGANKIRKALGYPVRIFQLYFFLRHRKPDVAISHSSFHSPLVARLLGIRSIYLNDNEHTLGNVPAFLSANIIMIPEYLDRRRALRQGAKGHKIIQYPGVKEGIYLFKFSDLQGETRSPIYATRKKTVYVRPEPRTALYYTGKVNFMDSLLIELKKYVRVVLLPRDEIQEEHYRKPEFSGITMPENVMGLADIALDCDIFIGAGGTMTREMAVLGIPTISVYQADLLDVDRHLIRTGHLIHKPDLDVEFLLEYLKNRKRMAPNTELLYKGRQAYYMIKSVLLGKSGPV